LFLTQARPNKTMNGSKDVIIIGGGPAGLHASICLARRGFDVTVLEEHPVAGEPVHCTGILAPEAFDEFTLPKSAILNQLDEVRFFSPAGQVVEYATERVEALVVDRREFDQGLGRDAVNYGVEICLDKKVTEVDVGKSCVRIRCTGEDRPRTSRACIIATGASYILQKSLGLGLPPVSLNSAQIEVPAAHQGAVELHFGVQVAPKGFAWVVPVRRGSGNSARVGLVGEGNILACFDRFLNRIRERAGINMDSVIAPRQRMLPLAPIRKTYAERLLVVGDAAGLVKPTTGGGIYYGLASAAIAAGVMADGLKADQLGEPALRAYQSRWQERILEELEAQLTLRLLMQRLTDPEIEGIFDLWSSNGLMPLIRKTAAFNHHRKLILALAKYPAMRKILFRRF
jgi:digeranylgeranylglycerophospholipid reductase